MRIGRNRMNGGDTVTLGASSIDSGQWFAVQFDVRDGRITRARVLEVPEVDLGNPASTGPAFDVRLAIVEAFHAAFDGHVTTTRLVVERVVAEIVRGMNRTRQVLIDLERGRPVNLAGRD